jgi:prevent-host-death family protein
MQVTIHEAKTQLSKLIAAVERGEEVIIARRDKPVVKMVAADPEPPDRKGALGSLKGFISEELVDFLTNNPALDKEIEEDFHAWEKEENATKSEG